MLVRIQPCLIDVVIVESIIPTGKNKAKYSDPFKAPAITPTNDFNSYIYDSATTHVKYLKP